MKKALKYILLTLATAVLLVTAVSADGLPFDDIPEEAWYYADVEAAYNTGLINGKSAHTFAPNSYLTYAEAVKLAACMNQLFVDGEITLTNGTPWYQSYVDYCRDNGIISREYDWGENATRAGYMEIFASAIPDSFLKRINNVPYGSIPDVGADHPQAEGIYKLYRAGILQGSDPITHSCNPDTNIRRSEVAAIISRITNADKRITFTMKNAGEFAFEIEKQPISVYADTLSGTATFSLTAGGEQVKYDWQMFSTEDGEWVSIGCKDDTLNVDYSLEAESDIAFYRCFLTDGGKTLVSNEVAVYPPLVQVEINTKPTDTRQLVSLILKYTSYSITEAAEIAEGESPIKLTLNGDAGDAEDMVSAIVQLGGEATVTLASAEGLCFVRLNSVGANKAEVIGLIDKYTDCGLTAARDITRGAGAIVGRNMTPADAAKFAEALQSAGAEVEIK